MHAPEDVKSLLRQHSHDLKGLAAGIGMGESSNHAYHAAAAQFWIYVLLLEDADALQPHERVFAENERDRHLAALEPTEIGTNRLGLRVV